MKSIINQTLRLLLVTIISLSSVVNGFSLISTAVQSGNPYTQCTSITTDEFVNTVSHYHTCSSLKMSSSSEEEIMQEEEEEAENKSSENNVKCPNCDLCDGSGRILGGIGVVLPWWPIKAYRPCPNFINNGGNYIRSGQPLDEIAFGRRGNFDFPSE